MKPASKIYPSASPIIHTNNREHNILVHQLVVKINQLQSENRRLREQLEHLNKINRNLIKELNEKTLALKQINNSELTSCRKSRSFDDLKNPTEGNEHR